MRPTEEQIRQAAQKFIDDNKMVDIIIKKTIGVTVLNSSDGMSNLFIEFAKTLFKETEEETWERVVPQNFQEGCVNYFAIAQKFHNERTRIENE